MPRITPFLWFDTQAHEAAEFYCSVFPNSEMGRITHYGAFDPRREGTVMTIEFSLDGQPFVALNGGPQFTFDEAVSFVIHCADQEEIDRYWEALSAGGEEGPCGWLKDRFGLSWQVVPTGFEELLLDSDEARRDRAMEAIMGMGKLDAAAIWAAADQV
jgi:predicted 3-demethylubiquinone-9 3-methyltransferase (glyoxalase superfamily)